MKKSLLLHHDFLEMFRLLTYEELGRLLIAAYEYDIYGTVTEFEDRMLTSCYIRIIDCLDRNTVRYEETCQRKAEAAKRRWEKIRQNAVENSN